jgi:hypothetical protein
VRKLEHGQVLEAYRDPYNRKKYVYFNEEAATRFAMSNDYRKVPLNSIIHDAKVIEIVRALYYSNYVKDFTLDHENRNNRLSHTFNVFPDASFKINRCGKRVHLALELELHRKNNQSIAEKMKQYNISYIYDQVAYIFPTLSLMNKYIEIAQENIKGDGLNRFIFLHHPNLSHKIEKLESINGVYQNQKINFLELFY